MFGAKAFGSCPSLSKVIIPLADGVAEDAFDGAFDAEATGGAGSAGRAGGGAGTTGATGATGAAAATGGAVWGAAAASPGSAGDSMTCRSLISVPRKMM